MSIKGNIFLAFLINLSAYGVKYLAYNFLSATVLLTFGALMTTYLTLFGPEMPWLQYLSVIIPIDGNGNALLDESHILRVFTPVALGLLAASIVGRGLKRVLKRLFRSKADVEPGEVDTRPTWGPVSSAKKHLLINGLMINVIYLVLIIVLPFAKLSEGSNLVSMYTIFIIFYLIAMVSMAIYVVIDTLSEWILRWGASNINT